MIDAGLCIFNALLDLLGVGEELFDTGDDFGLFLALGLIGVVTACVCTAIFLRFRKGEDDND